MVGGKCFVWLPIGRAQGVDDGKFRLNDEDGFEKNNI